MKRNENGDLIITKETQEIAKEVLVSVGLVFVVTRVIHYLLMPTCHPHG
ncbi:MAG: hypothetical protein HQ510_03970 [Candidatus Marinimicrobia bacterium]|nr:hypothetical protein [Candidatus Neomarinimicrobiota bacterium]